MRLFNGHLVTAVATFTTGPNSLPVEADVVPAVYDDASNFTGSTSNAFRQVVSPANTAATMSSTATGVVSFGTPVTFTAAVTDTDTGIVPAGQVQF
jgi:hypothetical protein